MYCKTPNITSYRYLTHIHVFYSLLLNFLLLFALCSTLYRISFSRPTYCLACKLSDNFCVFLNFCVSFIYRNAQSHNQNYSWKMERIDICNDEFEALLMHFILINH